MVNLDMMHISMLSVLIPTGLSLAVFNRLTMPLKFLAAFLLASCLTQGVIYYYFINSMNNLPLFHLFTFIEFIAISVMYYLIFKSSRTLRTLVVILSISFLLFSIINLFKWEDIYVFNSNQRFAEFIVLLTYFLLFFRIALKGTFNLPLVQHPYFILTLGYFIYFTGTIFLFLNANNFIALDIVNYWMIHAILSIFLNVIYFIVLWKGSKFSKLL